MSEAAASLPAPLLAVVDLRVAYGRIEALRGATLHVSPGEIVAVIGANGAGKTTLLRALSGLLPVAGGRIVLAGEDVTGQPAERLVRRGIVHVPERRQLFGELTVEDNLWLGAFHRYWRTPRAELRADLERVFELFPILRERRAQRAGTLSGGQQQMVAIGRGLMARGRILLLDEPSVGLAPLVVREIFAAVAWLRAAGTTILVVEQNARQALRVADRAYLLENGRVVRSGSAVELAADPAVQAVYLGHTAD